MKHRVLFVTAEYEGLMKVGGLADVSAGLPRALRSLGHDVRVLLPGYGGLNVPLDNLPVVAKLKGRGRWLRCLSARKPEPIVYLLDTPAFRRRTHPYRNGNGNAWPDDAVAFADLARVAALLAGDRLGLDWHAHIVHANEWHAGLAPVELLLERVNAASVFTIHNLAYQGVFPMRIASDLRLPRWLRQPGTLEYHGGISFLKAALVFADRLTAVSPGYAEEILTPAFGEGLDGVLRERRHELTGILNGIDMPQWNPLHDGALTHRFSAGDVSGKRREKQDLLRALGLEGNNDEPLLVFVGRLTPQKGIDLLLGALPRLMQMPLCFALLGSGDRALEQALRDAALRYRGRFAIRLRQDEALARRFYAAGDMLLVPSRFEPCGLVQMYGMRYGCVPIAHAVGGLRDSIVDADAAALANGSATGMLFRDATVDALLARTGDALRLFANSSQWQRVIAAAMQRNSAWTEAARQYEAVYREARSTSGI